MQCQYHVGVNSTAIYEGLAVSSPVVFIIKTGWYEEMENLYKRGIVFLVDSPGQIIESISRGGVPLGRDRLEELYNPNWERNLNSALKELIPKI